MVIGGIQKQSLIDYPGKMATVVFTKGCNLRCRYCHNPQLVLPDLMAKSDPISEEVLFAFLNKRLHWLDGVVVTGGEPTIHDDLPMFIEKIASIGFSVKLDTNGTNPDMLKYLLKEKRSVDFVAMDIKAPLEFSAYKTVVGPRFSNDLMAKIVDSVNIIKESGVEHQFRTTLDKSIDEEAMAEIEYSVGENVVWQQIQFYNGVLSDFDNF